MKRKRTFVAIGVAVAVLVVAGGAGIAQGSLGIELRDRHGTGGKEGRPGRR